MATRSWQLSRRDVLRGGGLALGLPLLDAMAGVASAGTASGGSSGASPAPAAAQLPKRMLVSYFAYGCYMPGAENGVPRPGITTHDEWSWWPCLQPGPLTFNKSSEPFAPFKDHVTYLRGLDHPGGAKLGGHSSGDVFATGADMVGTQKTNDISVDQVAAGVHGHHTRLPSLTLGTEGGTGSYGSSKTLSHRGPGRPIASLHRPGDIFNRLFNPYGGADVAGVRARLKREASVLDAMLDHGNSLRGRLGADDRRKMDEYLESVRAIEQRVGRTDEWTKRPLPVIGDDRPNVDASEKSPQDYVRCLYDLIWLAFRTDTTRFATLMLESENSHDSEMWNYANYALGYKGATHDIAHKRPPDFAGKWDRWRAEQHAWFLKRLADTPEGGGSMLDRTVVLWGSAHPHASHSTSNYPLHLAGGGALGLRHGRLHAFEGARKVPMSNLLLTMLHAVDVPVAKFADSTGTIGELLK